jgi:hypothetical protein
MSVEAELAEDTEQEDELCVFISDVNKGGPAAKQGNRFLNNFEELKMYIRVMRLELFDIIPRAQQSPSGD